MLTGISDLCDWRLLVLACLLGLKRIASDLAQNSPIELTVEHMKAHSGHAKDLHAFRPQQTAFQDTHGAFHKTHSTIKTFSSSFCVHVTPVPKDRWPVLAQSALHYYCFWLPSPSECRIQTAPIGSWVHSTQMRDEQNKNYWLAWCDFLFPGVLFRVLFGVEKYIY